MPIKKGMIHHVHDGMVKVVFSDTKEAASFLQSYLPNSVVKKIDWDTLTLKNVTYIDDRVKHTQSDLLYLAQLKESDKLIFMYILFEHQSKPKKWSRFALLKYMCRIWDESFKEFDGQDKLKPILPLIFYQGKTGWNYSKEFSDLVEKTDLGTDFIPKFEHFLEDQSKAGIEDIKGELKARVAQLLLLATARDQLLELIEIVADLITQIPETGGIDYVQVFVNYINDKHEYAIVLEFIRLVMIYSPELGEKMRSAAQDFKLIRTMEIVENMLKEGLSWDIITKVANVTQDKFNEFKQRVKELTSLQTQLGV